ncbi:response regulator transcription factor [Acinetobacter rudis]|uniref:Helix-turn-helix transcriptional regulator n=1 Tax=Acinetobacter rudis TaxID=632955 RepID=A0AAW8J9Y1_9GAMM|nr:helix-turn-helix transcriptional regulator [Acinetobacter rudis]MDQ8936575.1 helix-turn-helix transcriptional regulator [Acinetobacter rudis]MDQ8954189.1 helix-turn-helix transcriptional regulator [Acinetobacter rudis]MDQ9018836.1 helix-turn-helix transcriptional regulator [Acinetobacter rudis]
MDFQTWSGFVDRFTAALRQNMYIDAFFSYKIEHNLETSEHYFCNLSTCLVDQYLSQMQIHDPLAMLNHKDPSQHMKVLSHQDIPQQYMQFIEKHQFGDNIELYFNDQQTPVRGISLIRNAAQGPFLAEDLQVLERFYQLADFCMQQNFRSTFQSNKGLNPIKLQSFKLTKKQLQVLELLSQGKDNQQIAMQLFISLSTVKTHIQHIFQKLAVNNRAQLLSKLLLLQTAL